MLLAIMPAMLLAFLTGILSRIADMVADEGLKMNRFISLSLGIIYGFLIAFIIGRYPILSEMGLAIFLSVLLSGKIDHPVHYAGLVSFFMSTFFIFGFSYMNFLFFVVFMIGGAVDELGNALADRKKLKGIIGTFFSFRLTMEVLTLGLSVYTGEWIFFLAMLSFDSGFTYIFPDRFRSFLINKMK
jgi:hypothetical protein